jgi:hypothetical protein
MLVVILANPLVLLLENHLHEMCIHHHDLQQYSVTVVILNLIPLSSFVCWFYRRYGLAGA